MAGAARRGGSKRDGTSGNPGASGPDVISPRDSGGARGLGLAILLALVAIFVIRALFFLPAAAPNGGYIVTAYVPEYRLDHVLQHASIIGSWVSEIILFSVQVWPKQGLSSD